MSGQGRMQSRESETRQYIAGQRGRGGGVVWGRRLLALRREIAAGKYDTRVHLEAVVEGLYEELHGRPRQRRKRA